ncbi:DRTGG domain-containing protein [Lactococcus protaetiae]|uniref:CBS domain-containing protein n=1 Tax=Lactococcus protaetiae TaxID=2592653 RepID=A0A514Z8F8_9LACT|nr:DRTGG domain-containing protein [Lactococcus protaetiae]MCL2113383.1 DRTGG domain-containing protein [Streptococcaceae bacterium]QDK70869.1 CBS domain-containing protein [Lactococcus protaetiae]
MSKHEEILSYIEGLEIGRQVSVRGIANRMKVADGTAYRAIKEAENQGLVAVNDRSGTVRVAAKGQKVANRLTFGKLAEIANADVLGGLAGLEVEFNKFVISAMERESFKKYLSQNGLVIVGDRKDIQNLSLREHNAVLVTGGFDVDQDVIDDANRLGIPLLRTSYDTFTVANRISHALSNELIKKDIITVGDVFHQKRATLREENTVKDFLDLVKKTNYSRFAVLNRYNVVVGVIAMRDVNHKGNDTPLNKLMTRANVAKAGMTVASVSQKMIYEGYDMMPVVYDNHTYAGIITKSDLLQSLQKAQEESQVAHTFSEDVSDRLKEKGSAYTIVVEPFMINSVGSMAQGVFTEMISHVVRRVLAKKRKRNIIIESLNMHLMGAVAIDNVLEIYPKVISETRIGAMIDCEVYHVNNIVAKVLVNVQLT